MMSNLLKANWRPWEVAQLTDRQIDMLCWKDDETPELPQTMAADEYDPKSMFLALGNYIVRNQAAANFDSDKLHKAAELFDK